MDSININLICVAVLVVLVLMVSHANQSCHRCNCNSHMQGLTLSRKSFEEDNSLYERNPFDDMDYETPTVSAVAY